MTPILILEEERAGQATLEALLLADGEAEAPPDAAIDPAPGPLPAEADPDPLLWPPAPALAVEIVSLPPELLACRAAEQGIVIACGNDLL